MSWCSTSFGMAAAQPAPEVWTAQLIEGAFVLDMSKKTRESPPPLEQKTKCMRPSGLQTNFNQSLVNLHRTRKQSADPVRRAQSSFLM